MNGKCEKGVVLVKDGGRRSCAVGFFSAGEGKEGRCGRMCLGGMVVVGVGEMLGWY